VAAPAPASSAPWLSPPVQPPPVPLPPVQPPVATPASPPWIQAGQPAQLPTATPPPQPWVQTAQPAQQPPTGAVPLAGPVPFAAAPTTAQAPGPAPEQGQRVRALPVLDQIVVGVAGVLVLAAVVLTVLAPVYPSRGQTAKDFAARFPVPAGATGSPAPPTTGTPAPGTSPSAAAGQLPAGMVGTWTGTGTVTAGSDSARFTVTISLTGGAVGNVVGTSTYPAAPCTGNLTLVNVGTKVEVSEHITTRTDDCFDSTLYLAVDASGHLLYHFDDEGYGVGDATLSRH